MRLFKKGNTNTVECPHCGAKHQVEFLSYDNVCLDGMPKLPVSSLMKRFALCTKCGLLYTTGKHTPAKYAVTDEVYRNVFNMQYTDITEKKLCLLNTMYSPACIPLLLAHYYAETNQQEKRTQALQQAESYITSHRDGYVQELKSCGSLQFESVLLLFPEHRLIDIYRQMQNWDVATEQIQKIRAGKCNDALTKYLDLQEQLVDKKSSDIQ